MNLNSKTFHVIFKDAHSLMGVISQSHSRDFCVLDAYAPYFIEGLCSKVQSRKSRIEWICFLGGLLGFSGGGAYIVWITGFSWPLNIGGRPNIPWISMIPLLFEATVLFAGASTFLAFCARSRLWPGKVPSKPKNTVTDDQFELVLSLSRDREEWLKKWLREQGAQEIEETEDNP